MDPFKVKYAEDLREIPVDLLAYKSALESLVEAAETHKDSTAQNRIKILSEIGVRYRVIGDLEKSKAYLDRADEILNNEPNRRLKFINELRIAQTEQFLGHNAVADDMYARLISMADKNAELTELIDFVYQHRGKNYFDLGEYKLALEFLHKALALRRIKGNEELIDSSLFSISVLEKKMFD